MDFKDIAVEAAFQGGVILKEAFYMDIQMEGKGAHDVVTAADRQSEQKILNLLKRYFPGHSFVAEESGTIRTGSGYCWYIDPLDGTSHFITGNPYFSVSIALGFNDEIILGVVFAPVLDELYIAEKGKGAFLNGKPIQVNHKNRLEDAIVSTAYSAHEAEIANALRIIEKLALRLRKVVVNFSPALDLCNTARGRLDGLITKGTTPEDHAAGSLILSEAGGMVQNFGNERWDVDELGIIASNGHLQDMVAKLARF